MIAGLDAPERVLLETPERVVVGYDVAGIGHRALAFMIDGGILLVGWVLLTMLAGLVTDGAWLDGFGALSGPVQAALVVAGFLLNWSYALFFEWRWNGRTPGKRALGLRVIRTDGGPYDLLTAAVRNLTRALDGLPTPTYLVGLVSVVVTSDNRRLGDLLAGTVLVKDGAVDLDLYGEAAAEEAPDAHLALASLGAEAFEMAGAFLQRAEAMDPTARARVALATAAPLAARAGLPADEAERVATDPAAAEAFLRRVVSGPVSGGARRGAEGLVRFVRARRPDWDLLETRLSDLSAGRLDLTGLRSLDRLYRRATSDLAWVQTFFPGTAPARHLHRLCGRAYREVYRGAGEGRYGLRGFFVRGFPGAVWRARREVLTAALLLVGATLAGALVTWARPGVADLVLGPGLMHQVRSGRVWTDDLLSVMPPSVASAEILTNNISVTFAAFAGGLSAGLLTVLLLLLNGGLLGVAFAATARHGVGDRLLDFVAAHGPVELSVVVLASAAGLLVAGALISPGALSRADALRIRGRDAGRIVLGGVPLLVLVGLIEGFVSPGDAFPTWLKAALGLGLAGTTWAWLLGWGARAQAPADGPGRG